jgi:hypothetical protein
MGGISSVDVDSTVEVETIDSVDVANTGPPTRAAAKTMATSPARLIHQLI